MNKKQLRKKLALMLANLKKKRPYYCEVEYLESTGTQYIDTGILPSEDLRTKVVQAYTGTSIAKNASILGSNGNGNFRYWINYDSHFEIGYGNYFSTSVVVQPGDINTIDFNYIKNGYHRFSLNGTEYTVTGTPNTEYSIILFGRVVMTQTPILAPQRIYKVQFIRNDVLIGDFIPVLDWDMTPCMYDKVSGQLFYNQGTDDFSYGREIHYVDYLESTGTQYIDTGVVLSSTDKVEVSVEYTGEPTQGSSYAFGTFGSSKNFGINCTLKSNPKNWYGVWYNQGTLTSSSIFSDLNTRYDIQVSSNGMYINGNLFTTVSGTFTGSVSAYLFWANGTSQPKSLMKLYSCKMWQSGVLVRDYLPAIDSEGRGYMFDRVSHTCFLNQGTGQFSYPAREVEYLESTGTQYIDTGYIPTNSTGMKLSWTRADNADRAVMGTRHSSAGDTRFFIGAYSQGMYISWNTLYVVPTTTQINTFYETSMNYKNDRKRFLDGAELSQITVTLASINQPIYLFWIPAATNKALSKIKYAQITEGSELVRDLIPCYKDGVLGMYDKVNKIFYTNAGTGTFTTGKIVEPEYE